MARVSGGSTGGGGTVTLPVGENGAPLYSKDGQVVSDANADLRSKSLQAQEEVGTSGSLAGGALTISNAGGTVLADEEEIDHSAQDETIKWTQIYWVKDLLATAAEGCLNLTTAGNGTSISWPAGKCISLVNSGGVLELIRPNSAISFVNTALDINSTMLAGGTTPYAVYFEHNDTTTGVNVVFVPWTNATTRSVELADWLGFEVYDLTDTGKTRRFVGDILPRIHWNPAAAWSALTTYKIGEQCTDSGHTYQSLVSGNLNHAVADTDWWVDCGESPGDGRGMFADERQFRLVLNKYNPIPKEFGVPCPYTAQTSEALSNISTPRVWMKDANNNTVFKAECLCDGEGAVFLAAGGLTNGTGAAICASIGIDSMTAFSSASTVGVSGQNPSQSIAIYSGTPAAGYHYFVPLVESWNGPTAYYWLVNSNAQAAFASMIGTWRG